jgi:hypothetical protein
VPGGKRGRNRTNKRQGRRPNGARRVDDAAREGVVGTARPRPSDGAIMRGRPTLTRVRFAVSLLWLWVQTDTREGGRAGGTGQVKGHVQRRATWTPAPDKSGAGMCACRVFRS